MIACDAGAQAARLARLRVAMADEGLSAFCVRNTASIRWATAFDGVFDEESAHALVVTPDRAVLHTDSRYADACRRAAEGTGVEVDDARETHAAVAARVVRGRIDAGDAVLSSAGDGSIAPLLLLGIEDSISLAEFRRFEAASSGDAGAPYGAGAGDLPGSGATLSLRETSGFVVGLRAVKDAGEIARMKAAQAITDAAFAHIVSFMRPGLTEREVQVELEDFMVRHGAESVAFPSIVACGANGASPHSVPGDARLEAGQCVVLDFGARAQGYCSDMTRTVFLGEPSARMREAYETIHRANEQVEAALSPGVTGAEMHRLAEDVLSAGGFAGKMGHSLGHGVGIDIHEEPALSPRNTRPLEAGSVVTVEPGIYLPGEFGMRLEDFGVITPEGFTVFTQSTHEMIVL